MRTYAINSPQASARIVALAMLADGHNCKTEFDALDVTDVRTQLGLQPAEMQAVVHALCEDLLLRAHGQWEEASKIDAGTLTAVLAEIDDPALRATILRLCVAVVAADEHVAGGENDFLVATAEYWGMYSYPHDQSTFRWATHHE